MLLGGPRGMTQDQAILGRRQLTVAMAVFGGLGAFNPFKANAGGKYPIVGEESIMSKKEHGTSRMPVQKNLKYDCD